jgi:hypothetical protein
VVDEAAVSHPCTFLCCISPSSSAEYTYSLVTILAQHSSNKMSTSTSQTLTTQSLKLSSSSSSSTSLSTLWWNTNLHSHDHTPACPPFLTYALAHPKERANLSTLDADFKRQTWPEVRAHVAANRLDQFTRVPSELRRYRQYTEKLVREYGSVMRFVLDERLGWRDSRFGDESMCFSRGVEDVIFRLCLRGV